MLSEENFGRRMTPAERFRIDVGIIWAREMASAQNVFETVSGQQLPITQKIPLATAVQGQRVEMFPDGYGRKRAKALKRKLTIKEETYGGMLS